MSALLDKLHRAFVFVENVGGIHPGFAHCRVGSVFLNRTDALAFREPLPEHRQHFEWEVNREVLQALPGLIGYLWGARIFATDNLRPDHVVILQDGIQATVTDDVAGIPFDLFPAVPTGPRNERAGHVA